MHLLIPTGPEWVCITDMDQMEDHLLEHSHKHFWQAHGTPFTQPPMTNLLGFSGLIPFGDLIFNGCPIPDNLHLDPITCLLLTHQRSLLPPNVRNTHPLEFEPLMNGF